MLKDKSGTLPPSKWPIKKGTRVWCCIISPTIGPCVFEGRVWFYNPATEDSSLITKGKPIFNIRTLGRNPTSFIVSTERVFPGNASGRLAAHELYAAALDARVDQAIENLRVARFEAVQAGVDVKMLREDARKSCRRSKKR